MIGMEFSIIRLERMSNEEQTQAGLAYHQNQGPELVRTMVYRSSVSSHGLVAGTEKPAGGDLNFFHWA
jgi:hypothetical protein